MQRAVLSTLVGMFVGAILASGSILFSTRIEARTTTAEMPLMKYAESWDGNGGGSAVALGNAVKADGYGYFVPRLSGGITGPLMLHQQVQFKSRSDTHIRAKATLFYNRQACCGEPADPLFDVLAQSYTNPQFVPAMNHLNTVVPIVLDCPDDAKDLAVWVQIEEYEGGRKGWRPCGGFTYTLNELN